MQHNFMSVFFTQSCSVSIHPEGHTVRTELAEKWQQNTPSGIFTGSLKRLKLHGNHFFITYHERRHPPPQTTQTKRAWALICIVRQMKVVVVFCWNNCFSDFYRDSIQTMVLLLLSFVKIFENFSFYAF